MQIKQTRTIIRSESGSIAIILGISLPILLILIDLTITYTESSRISTEVQGILDTAALAAAKDFNNSNSNDAEKRKTVQNYLQANQNRISDIVAATTINFDDSNSLVKLSYNSSIPFLFSTYIFNTTYPIKVASNAGLTTAGLTPVCILITDASAGHTLKTSQQSRLEASNCLIQVNTNNWDAVQADDTSYIHILTPNSGGNWNCYVGSIHFGDVSPAKQPTCTLLPDPFSGKQTPSSGGACTDNAVNHAVSSGSQTFSPGTYCQDVIVSGNAQAIFSPGVYIFNSASLVIQGNSNVSANGVVFILTGAGATNTVASQDMGEYAPAPPPPPAKRPGPKPGSGAPPPGPGQAPFANDAGQIQINTSGSVSLSPLNDPSSAFNGFLIFQDQSAFADSTTPYGSPIGWSSATVSSSGIIYLADVALTTSSLNWTHNGSLIADMFLPQNNSYIRIFGDPNSQLKKATTKSPTLIK